MERKVMEIRDKQVWIVVKFVRDNDKYNPYRMYIRDYSHRRLIAKYADLHSCVEYMNNFFTEGMDMKTWEEIVDWSKDVMALYRFSGI